MKTLVLNASWEPIAVVTMHRAVILVMAEKAEIVEETGEYLHSQRAICPIPSVIKVKKMVKVPYMRRIPLSRRAILARDNYECGYCGKKAETIDHIVPKSQGGKHSWNNVAAACKKCNYAKAARTPKEWGVPLKIVPKEPRGIVALVVILGSLDEKWASYLAVT